VSHRRDLTPRPPGDRARRPADPAHAAPGLLILRHCRLSLGEQRSRHLNGEALKAGWTRSRACARRHSRRLDAVGSRRYRLHVRHGLSVVEGVPWRQPGAVGVAAGREVRPVADHGSALIKDAGHFAAFTQPDQFLTELLTRVRPLAGPTTPLSSQKDGQ
jgi:hypothetical protein